MLRKIKLYGQLAEFIGHKEFEVCVANVAQAVSFLIHNFPEVESYMSPKYYQVKIGNYAISEEEISYPIGQEDIHFVPVISGRGSIGRILVGAALIGLSFGVGGFFAAPMTFAQGATIGLGAKITFGIGAALVLGGVSEMLFPMPDMNDFDAEEDPRLSFSFSGIQNTSRAGTPVPIVYGEIFTGSVVISAAIDTNQVDE
tara:strand:- start:47 stop:646 length:600 start_codon:yes stop_codon:yes gene_type:complete